MILLEDALAAYARELRCLPAETIAIDLATGRVLAEPLAALTDLPRFDQSAMDGYALRAADVAGAGSDSPIRLRVEQLLAAGAYESLPLLSPGVAARIFTGAPIPPGADTVIPQERVTRAEDELVFTQPYAPRRNIRWRGEELREATTIAQIGQRITPGLLASLINGGITELRVQRRPRIRLLVTGDEVRPAGTRLQRGQIPDSNGPLVRAALARLGYAPPSTEYVADTEDAVRDALARAFAESELVLSCGGASVGDRDFVVAAAEQLGVRRVFWKVAQKPGKPMFFGIRETEAGQSALLALPGNPGAVLLGMALHARRALELLEGAVDPAPHWKTGVLREAVESDAQRARLLRMSLAYDESGTARLSPLPNQDSHMLSNLATADVLVWVPMAAAPAEAGTRLRWLNMF